MTNANPLDFKSTDFTINKEEKKKGGWKVTIKYKDVHAIRVMNFELYENGSANLNVTMTDRTPITFIGTVGPLK
jgi:PDZ domain-containing secreted protein